jgi:hypothetical protein
MMHESGVGQDDEPRAHGHHQRAGKLCLFVLKTSELSDGHDGFSDGSDSANEEPYEAPVSPELRPNSPVVDLMGFDDLEDHENDPEQLEFELNAHENQLINDEIDDQMLQLLAEPHAEPVANHDESVEEAMPIHNPLYDGIFMPETLAEIEALVGLFREEIYQDWSRDLLRLYGINQVLDAHQLDHAEREEALRMQGQPGVLPFITRADIIRHDWSRHSDCIYTILANGVRIRGPPAMLSHQVQGLRRACWEYWRTRPRVSERSLLHHFERHGGHGYYQVIMWHNLPIDRWLALWRFRRASRRG